jgi:hypothetical protein
MKHEETSEEEERGKKNEEQWENRQDAKDAKKSRDSRVLLPLIVRLSTPFVLFAIFVSSCFIRALLPRSVRSVLKTLVPLDLYRHDFGFALVLGDGGVAREVHEDVFEAGGGVVRVGGADF